MLVSFLGDKMMELAMTRAMMTIPNSDAKVMPAILSVFFTAEDAVFIGLLCYCETRVK